MLIVNPFICQSDLDILFYEHFLERDSLLRNDSLLFCPAIQEGRTEVPVEYRPPQVADNNGVVCLLLGSFLLLVFVVLFRRRSAAEQMSNFLYPPLTRAQAASPEKDDNRFPGIWFTDVLLTMMCCLLLGMLYYIYADRHWALWMVRLTVWHWLGLYFSVCFLFFVLKQLIVRLINTIFFPRSKRLLWQHDYDFLFNLECILLLPVALIAIFSEMTAEYVIYVFLFVLVFVKILVLIKDYTYFFAKIHGLLHLFVYFCALEAVPLLVLWTVLGRLTNYMTTNL